MYSKYVLVNYFGLVKSRNWWENGQWPTAISGSDCIYYCIQVSFNDTIMYFHKFPSTVAMLSFTVFNGFVVFLQIFKCSKFKYNQG